MITHNGLRLFVWLRSPNMFSDKKIITKNKTPKIRNVMPKILIIILKLKNKVEKNKFTVLLSY